MIKVLEKDPKIIFNSREIPFHQIGKLLEANRIFKTRLN